MKSLPEKDFWNNIKTRLDNYTEDPGDDWDDIDAILSLSRYDHRKWFEFGVDVLSAAILLALFLYFTPAEPTKDITIDTSVSVQQNILQQSNSSSASEQKEQAQVPVVSSPAFSNSEQSNNAVASDVVDITPADDNYQHGNNGQQKISTSTISSSKNIVPQKKATQNHFTESSQKLHTTSGLHATAKRQLSGNGVTTSKNSSIFTDRTNTQYNTNTQQSNNTITQEKNNDANNTINTDTSRTSNIASNSSLTSQKSPDTFYNQTASTDNNGSTEITAASSDKTEKDSLQADTKEKAASKAKSEDIKKKSYSKKFRPAVYFTLSPTLAYQKVTPIANDQVDVTGLKSDGIFSGNRAGFSFDAGFQVPILARMEWYIGASYYQQSETITYEYSTGKVTTIENNDPLHYTIKPGTAQRDFSYSMRNAGIATGIFYHLKTDKLMHKLGVGLQYQKGFRQSGEESSYQNSSSSYFNYQILYRLELTVNNRVNIYLQPGFTHAIRANEKLQEPFTLKPYHAAIGLGLIYRF
ncbi:MAG TPA: hypothetical protein VIN08_07740 [Ohtaekwangia sp.]|uniref:hypothetical protein n=1 Tax=Ohtaekwangia sp. TaxID=2066019 RepID=UPI002F925C7B